MLDTRLGRTLSTGSLLSGYPALRYFLHASVIPSVMIFMQVISLMPPLEFSERAGKASLYRPYSGP